MAVYDIAPSPGAWLIDSQGQPIASDFVNVWAAGHLALQGHAADAYDWTLHKAAEVAAVGHGFDNYYGWHYPPTFLFAAAAVALLFSFPYTKTHVGLAAAAIVAALIVQRAAIALRGTLTPA